MTNAVASQDLADVKTQARRNARQVRARAHEDHAAAAAALAATGLGFLGQTAGIVSGFVPYQTEIDLMPLLQALTADGWCAALPVVLGDAQPLEFRKWSPGDELVPGVWNIPVPAPEAAAVEPDVLLVPLRAFDAAGYRLGYGGGFYDRSLEGLRARKTVTAVGVGYAAQQVDAVPRGRHDQPLDWILTEQGPFRPAMGQAGG